MPEDKTGSFSWALEALKDGKKMYRAVWENWQYAQIQKPGQNCKMTLSYLFWSPQPGLLIPWTPSQSDILCDDWEIVIPKSER